MTSISTFDQTEIYIISGPNTPPAAFSEAVVERLPSLIKNFPDDAYIAQFQSMENFSSPPKVKISSVAHIQLTIDRKKAARHGIGISSVYARIKAKSIDLNERPPTEKTVNALRQLAIPAPSGSTLRLRDLAEIKIVTTPSHRINRWPTTNPRK